MAIEFTQNPTTDTKQVSIDEYVIPRLHKMNMKLGKLEHSLCVSDIHYHGNKKLTPPTLATKQVCCYENVRGKTKAWRSSLEHNVAWLTAVVQGDHDGVLVSDWNGYMFNLAQQSGTNRSYSI